jgi:transposase
MKPLSLDLRRRIVAAYERGEGTQAQIAQRFGVGQASVERLVRLKRETGALDPKPHAGGTTARITEADRDALIETFAQEPDLRQEDLAERFTAQGRSVSRATVGRSLKRLRITRKKRP